MLQTRNKLRWLGGEGWWNYYNLITTIKNQAMPIVQIIGPNFVRFTPLSAPQTDYINLALKGYSPRRQLIKPKCLLTEQLKPHWIRLMFRGKAFRLRYYKKFNRFFFNLGFSHPTKLVLHNIFLGARKPRPKERTRQRYAIFTFNSQALRLLQQETQAVKPYNFYTQRGLRLRSQAIGRRFGKISQHISSLH